MVCRPLNTLKPRLVVLATITVLQCSTRAQPAEPRTSPAGISYWNPRVYNVDYSFEMTPDPNDIDRTKDLKLWLPIPREWDSQRSVKILSVQPEPHGRYVDPEYGNPMLFWDFGQTPEQATYKVNIQFRLESYEVSVNVDPNQVGPYDKSSKEYALYTRSTHTIHITPKIEELAREAIGNERNPYRQARRIWQFVNKRMRYEILDYERGRGIDVLLAYPVIDEKTGQECYKGCCNQYATLMVALCRAVGIPARCVSGYIGWAPWIGPGNVKAEFPFETKLSPEGLAGTQHYGGLGGHMWSEFFIPNYGWIPAYFAQPGKTGDQHNHMWIKSKGRDVLLGPVPPPQDGVGYGRQWVALHDGRADTLSDGVANIAKIHTIKVTVLHHSDPFPADGLATYLENLLPSGEAKNDLTLWRQELLGWPSRWTRSLAPENLNLDRFYREHPRAKDDREAFVCHMLRRQLGDERFFRLVKMYLDLRQKAGEALSTSRFQGLAEDIYEAPLDWFFNQWTDRSELPRLRLENVTVRKVTEGWQVRGRLLQSGDFIFQLPVELAIETRNAIERRRLWVEKKAVDFGFSTPEEPRRLLVDPDGEVLKIQKMPPRLLWFYDRDPEYLVVYGTLAEAQANEKIADQFVEDELGYDREMIKADVDVNDADLKTRCVFLIGRPESNKVAQQLKDHFPIKLDGAGFTWQGTTYDRPTQGVAQVIESPADNGGLIIMYAGMSPEATLKLPDLGLYDSDSSYVIFDGDKQLACGDWEDADPDLSWSRDTRAIGN